MENRKALAQKIQALPREDLKRHRASIYFLYYIAPLLLGMFLMLSQQAHANWNDRSDENFSAQPQVQGWRSLEQENRDGKISGKTSPGSTLLKQAPKDVTISDLIHAASEGAMSL